MGCWCGNAALQPFSREYQRCGRCETLVASALTDRQRDPRVADESTALYGRDYFFEHQTKDLNCPDLDSRARTDLSERCLHWLRTLLRFKLPPARVLEIGCAHGGFVAMLRQAGFDASGLELSPWVSDYARKTFGVDVLTGPVEDQDLPAKSLDVIALMDVMEHLPTPRATFSRCLELLREDGVLLIQTPCYPAGQSHENLRNRGHKFCEMLDPGEHLFLFSERAAAKLFAELGAEHISFQPAIFGFYDMSFIVSRQPLTEIAPETAARTLMQSVQGRFIQSMLDLDARRLALLDKFRTLRNCAA